MRSADGVEGRREEEPELPEDDRQREHEAGVDADHDGDRERLRHSERHGRLVVGRQRAVQPVEKVRVEEVGEDRPDGDRAEHDEEPAAQLLEVLAESRLLGVAETARKPRHVLARRSRARARLVVVAVWRRPSARRAGAPAAATSSSEWPVTASLNSRIPCPSDLPISGSRLPPKRSSAIKRSRTMCQGVWKYPMSLQSSAFALSVWEDGGDGSARRHVVRRGKVSLSREELNSWHC